MSRSDSSPSSYHHGDLRNALIAAGVKMLSEHGEQNISMRKLAQAAGVSHNAPYMHFADKEALLAAIAEEGFNILSAAVETAVVAANGDWQKELAGSGWAYVQFALAHPGHFNVMFRAYDSQKYLSLSTATGHALTLLTEVVANGQAQGFVAQGEPKELATATWSLLHGIATILANRKMPSDVIGQRTPQELVHWFVVLLYHGLAQVKP